jgi:hypothetical protein
MGIRGAVAILAISAVASVATAGPAPAATDADRVRAVLTTMNNSYNRSDFVEFAAHLCADMLQTPGFAAGWYQSRRADGPTRITINSVNIAGDDAIANVRFEAAERVKTLDIDFVRENADWKACRYNAGQTV